MALAAEAGVVPVPGGGSTRVEIPVLRAFAPEDSVVEFTAFSASGVGFDGEGVGSLVLDRGVPVRLEPASD